MLWNGSIVTLYIFTRYFNTFTYLIDWPFLFWAYWSCITFNYFNLLIKPKLYVKLIMLIVSYDFIIAIVFVIIFIFILQAEIIFKLRMLEDSQFINGSVTDMQLFSCCYNPLFRKGTKAHVRINLFIVCVFSKIQWNLPFPIFFRGNE